MTIEQDAEYLEAVKGLLIEAVQADRGPRRNDGRLADNIMGIVRDAGLVLVTEADWQAMVAAYAMQAIR